jgi:hypothetical protein
VPYKADLNGDCIVDYLDVLVYEDYFEWGLPAFAPWGGYPVLTCCDPNQTHGACCIDNAVCQVLHPTNCADAQGEYWGDGITCYLLPGDANGDMSINVGDMVYLISFLEKGGPAPYPLGNGDPNGDGCIAHDDVAFINCIIETGGALQPVECTNPDAPVCEWDHCMPGDANYDGDVNVADAIFTINFVFLGGPLPQPYGILSGDANGDGGSDISDAVYIINYVFNGGPRPPTCGEWMLANPCIDPHYGTPMYP